MYKIKKSVMGMHSFWADHGDASLRYVRPEVSREGWISFVDKQVKPMIDLGLERLMLHTPFGANPAPRQSMDFSQYLDCKASGPEMLWKDFAKAWKPITKQIEVVAYFGDPRSTASLMRYKTKKHSVDNWVRYAIDCLHPALDSDMNIGIDISCDYDFEDPEWKLMDLLNSLGCKQYIETYWAKEKTHYHDFPCFVAEAFWPRTYDGWGLEREKQRAEALRISNMTLYGMGWHQTMEWYPRWFAECWNSNANPCATITPEWLSTKTTVAELIYKAGKYGKEDLLP